MKFIKGCTDSGTVPSGLAVRFQRPSPEARRPQQQGPLTGEPATEAMHKALNWREAQGSLFGDRGVTVVLMNSSIGRRRRTPTSDLTCCCLLGVGASERSQRWLVGHKQASVGCEYVDIKNGLGFVSRVSSSRFLKLQ